jgi:hypothetical protein
MTKIESQSSFYCNQESNGKLLNRRFCVTIPNIDFSMTFMPIFYMDSFFAFPYLSKDLLVIYFFARQKTFSSKYFSS